MNQITTFVTFRLGVVATLCVAFVVYLPLRVSSAVSRTNVAADLKSESEFRSEASRYEAAIRAIGGIATMKLDTGNDLRSALEILKRETVNLRFFRSKLVALALSDSTVMGAAKRRATDKRAAEEFTRELNGDPNSVLKLTGADALKTRLQRSRDADAATLNRAAEKLKEAAERLQKSRAANNAPPGSNNHVRLIRTGFSEQQPVLEFSEAMSSFMEPVSIAIASILIAVFVAAVLYPLAFSLTLPIVKLIVTEDPDGLAECEDRADNRQSRCLDDANNLPSGLPFFQREAAIALCYVQRLQAEAACLIAY